MSTPRERARRGTRRVATAARRVSASLLARVASRLSPPDTSVAVAPELSAARVATEPDHVQLEGFLEQPVDGREVPPSLVSVTGWASIVDMARIEIEVEGQPPALARQMAHPRPDVIPHLASVHAGFSGFEQVVDLTRHAEGDRVGIRVTAVDRSGGAHRIGTTVVTIGRPVDPVPTDAERVATLHARNQRNAKLHQPAPSGVRLLAVTHDLALGGGQLYLQELLLRLYDRPGIEARVVSPADGPLREELEANGIEVDIVGPYPTDPVEYEALLRSLISIAGEFETTAVVANTSGAVCGIDLAARIDVPSLWAIHESYAPEQFLLAAYGSHAHPSAGDRLEEALTSASAVIFEAEATRRLYCTHGDPRRFLRIGYGIPIDAIDAYQAADDRRARRRAQGWEDDDVVLLCVGTFEPRKAQASLLRAFARVAPDHPDATLVLVGDRHDWYDDELRDYAERLDLGDRLRIEPVSADCYDWYAVADAFVLASDVESLPRSVLEAMAFGATAVVTDVFGLHDLIADGDTGLLFAPRDLQSLESALRRLLTMAPDERRAVGARGAAHIRADYDSRGYAAVFRRLIDGFATDASALPEAFL